MVVVLGSRDRVVKGWYGLVWVVKGVKVGMGWRGNFLIQSDTIRFIFFTFEKFAVVVVVVGSRDYNIRQNLLTLD